MLQNTQVELRDTLSYFIEPNPSARGGASKYHYPSHRLRFAIKRHTESLDELKSVSMPQPKLKKTLTARPVTMITGEVLLPSWRTAAIWPFTLLRVGGGPEAL